VISNEKLSVAAATALGILGEPRAVNLLIPLLDHPDSMLRGIVAKALGRIKDPRALPALRHASETDHEYYVTRARVSDLAKEAIALIEADSLEACANQEE
jgi:HEAT repeat protein